MPITTLAAEAYKDFPKLDDPFLFHMHRVERKGHVWDIYEVIDEYVWIDLEQIPNFGYYPLTVYLDGDQYCLVMTGDADKDITIALEISWGRLS